MKSLGHGANVAEMAEAYGIDEGIIIDFSSNINPYVSEGLKEHLEEALMACVNYPDIHYTKLKREIADYLKCEGEQIIPGNGATEIIYLLMKSLAARAKEQNEKFTLGIVQPTFSEYERSARMNGIEVVDIRLKKENGFKLDRQEIEDGLSRINALMICNPNNPTGNVQDIKWLLECCEASGILLIVDETFMEFVEEERSLVSFISQYQQLIIIKAITKFFGLPGLRLGYGVSSNQRLLEAMYKDKEPWTINSFAEQFTGILLRDKAYIEKSKAYFKEERVRVVKALSTLENMVVYEPAGNFILIELKNKTAASVRKALLINSKILIRDASNFKGLDDHFIRVAIKSKKDNDLMIQALRQYVG